MSARFMEVRGNADWKQGPKDANYFHRIRICARPSLTRPSDEFAEGTNKPDLGFFLKAETR
jgi:hypothetical protein